VTPPVEIRPPAHRPSRASGRATRLGVAALAVAGSALVLWLMAAVVFRDPEFVDRVRIDNPTGFDIHVDISERDAPSRLPLGVAGQQCTTHGLRGCKPLPALRAPSDMAGSDHGECRGQRAGGEAHQGRIIEMMDDAHRRSPTDSRILW